MNLEPKFAELKAALARGETPPVQSPAERSLFGAVLYEAARYPEALSAFEAALAEAAELDAADPDAEDTHSSRLQRLSTRYNAACVAARLAGAASEPERGSLRARALQHLTRDVERQRALSELGPQLASRGLRLSSLFADAAREHLLRARDDDPDLASLRGSPEFEALFAFLPD